MSFAEKIKGGRGWYGYSIKPFQDLYKAFILVIILEISVKKLPRSFGTNTQIQRHPVTFIEGSSKFFKSYHKQINLLYVILWYQLSWRPGTGIHPRPGS